MPSIVSLAIAPQYSVLAQEPSVQSDAGGPAGRGQGSVDQHPGGKKTLKNDPWKIQDVDPRAFEILISFMTGDAVRFQSVPTALNVIYAAKKYMVRKIDDLALKFIYKNINSHNVLLVLQNVLMLQEEPEVLPSAPSLALLDQVELKITEFKRNTDANTSVAVNGNWGSKHQI